MTRDQIKSLQLEITSYCNAKCPHCPRFTSDGNLHSDLSLDHWNIDAVLRNLELDKLSSLVEVTIEGDKGDPASHPDLAALLDPFLAHENLPLVRVVTNGSIRSPAFWRDLGTKVKGTNVSVTFSIDGLENTNHMYRIGIKYQRIVANAQAYIEAGGHAVWKCIVFEHNQHQLTDIKKLAQQMGFAEVVFTLPRLYEFAAKPQWFIYDRQKLLGELRPPSAVTDKDLQALTESFQPRKHSPKVDLLDKICPNLSAGHLYVTYRHHVTPCCMMHNIVYERHHNPGAKRMVEELVGNLDSIDLSKNSISEILMSNFFDHALENHFHTGPHLPICAKSCKKQIITNLQNQKRLNKK